MLVGVDEDDFDAADLLELATADPGRFEQQHVRARYAQPGLTSRPSRSAEPGSTTTWRFPSASTVQPLRSSGSRSSAWNAAPRARPGSVEQDGVTGADDDRAAIQPEVDGHDEDPTVRVDQASDHATRRTPAC